MRSVSPNSLSAQKKFYRTAIVYDDGTKSGYPFVFSMDNYGAINHFDDEKAPGVANWRGNVTQGGLRSKDDDGSAHQIIEAGTLTDDEVLAIAKKIVGSKVEALENKLNYLTTDNTVGLYTVSDEDKATIQTLLDKYNNATSVQECEEVDEQLDGCDAMFQLVTPTVGKFYRLKNVASGRYLADIDGAAQMKQAISSGENRNTTVFYLDENNGLVSFSNGCYLNCETKAFAVVGTKFNGTFGTAYSTPTANVVTYSSDGNYWVFGNRSDGVQIDRGAPVPNAEGYNWTLEEVNWLPVPMNTEIGYATMYSPVQLGLGSGSTNRVKVYAAKANIGGTAVELSECTAVPANTGVILEYLTGIDANGCVYLPVQDATVTDVYSDLKGTFAAEKITEDGYVLSKPADGEVALYKAINNLQTTTENDSWKNNGFKAYLPGSKVGASARFLTFDFGTETGIKTVENAEAANAVIYDLSGRRVRNAQKGLYIVNGKKVVK